MKKILVSLAVAAAAAASANAAKAPKATPLTNATDSVSYAMGANVAQSLEAQFMQLPVENINIDLFVEALSKVLKHDTLALSIKLDEAMPTINRVMQQASEEKAMKDIAANKIWLANNKTKPGVIETPSGLQYQVLQQGSGAHPRVTDKVKVDYVGTLTDGTTFDSSIDRGQPAEFELTKVIKGWTEGIQLMSPGSKFRFFIPSDLAYGPQSMGKIKPNSILIFDVTLHEIVKQMPKNDAKFQFKPYQPGL